MTRPLAYLLALTYLIGAGVGVMVCVQAVCGLVRWIG